MRWAILSDIHSNLEALEEAFAYLRNEKVDQCLFLGDYVGYGANPNECLELIAKVAGKMVAGNHDKALYDNDLAACFSDFAYEALLWTRGQIRPQWQGFLTPLPLLHKTESFTMAHGSIDCPETFQYLFYFDDAAPSFERMQTPVGFVGHTHVPQIFLKRAKQAAYLREGSYQLDKKEVYLVNPGSIGQPRDRDPRLSLALFDDHTYQLKLVRLPYDNQKAALKIREAGLPTYLADRLL